MPFYEYECPSCRYYLEVLQKISDPPLKKCPSCRKAGFKRLMSAPVFRLKGSGWYETDFKSDKEGQRNLAGAEPAEAKDAKADAAKAGGEDKAAAKPEAAAPGADAAKADSAKAAANKPEAAPPRRAKRAVKRPVVRPARKSPRAPKKRGSRRR
jgi:putative FmdB family regulatory protein